MSAIAANPEEGPQAVRMRERVDSAWALVEHRLAEAPYFAGPDFTAADIMMVYGLTTTRSGMPHDLSASPHTLAYLKRIGARPAYQRAKQKADPSVEPLLS